MSKAGQYHMVSFWQVLTSPFFLLKNVETTSQLQYISMGKMRVFYAAKFFNIALAERPCNQRNRKALISEHLQSACFCLLGSTGVNGSNMLCNKHVVYTSICCITGKVREKGSEYITYRLFCMMPAKILHYSTRTT